ncbi:cell wall hydrolase [Pelotomaculum terephthalicicum JT]|uniref:cell wall hydrolase n=1 Tax=Pelotomaculum TaxID=191373 RepID=UPI0009D07382|nr:MULTISPECIES: cell wall hydrolase [Pelotomaculum]MCG9967248.1 cell wall hydrolase [Pelotomaculum terephthalicicum JT]OPX88651.1 MAG: Spore cortex-lytic enzyme precursor [Pelotomaculum sp. PtaB.Bin117]OPY63573.1 MAG: Spore cortex-lytic enzyme precursor [Pelotomaculum sp. PtaU1.Bin065]
MSKYVPRLAVNFFKATLLALASLAVLTIALPRGECFQNTGAQITDQSDSTLNCIVQEGDTLSDIACRRQVSVRELMKVNNLTGSLIIPGQVLIMPEKSKSEESLSRGDVSREDLMLLARLIHAEARGESFEGQVAVGAVILNRLASPHFPKTIREVIYQKSSRVYQFSPVGDGSINLEPNEKAMQAAVQALQGTDPTGGALFFYNPDISRDQWIRTLPVIIRIGNHVFASVTT